MDNLELIKEGLKENGFEVKYHLGKKEYVIYKNKDIFSKLWLSEEAILYRGVDGISNEYEKMISFFNERELFLNNIKFKTISELSFNEFKFIHDEKIAHKGVNNAVLTYWDNLSLSERKRIRRLTDGYDAPYKCVAEYIYKKAVGLD